jgi:Cu/Ag efflux pump CusA
MSDSIIWRGKTEKRMSVLEIKLKRSGYGAEFYAPLGQTIFGGLLSSTIITLILIPILYYIVESKNQT